MPKIQLRHDTSTNWTTYNPVLLEGEVGVETDTNKMKIGDGSTAWNSLPYYVPNQRNIGEIIQSTIPLADAGLHLLDGTLISGSGSYSAFVDYIADLYNSGNYSDIFETEANWQTSVTTYGVCGKFVYDSTDNTVRLPKITGFTEGTIDPTVLGDLVEAGLPNITGYAGNQCRAYSADGALYGTDYYSTAPENKTWGAYGTVNLDASRSSSIYGNSPTVQPQAIKVLYYIVIATTTKTDIEVDIDDIATDLNGKADVDLSNVPASKGILTESYINGTSWYRVYSDGWCEQGGQTSNNASNSSFDIGFLKNFADTNYNFLSFHTYSATGDAYQSQVDITAKTTSKITLWVADNHGTLPRIYYWTAKGYIN